MKVEILVKTSYSDRTPIEIRQTIEEEELRNYTRSQFENVFVRVLLNMTKDILRYGWGGRR